MCPVVPHAVTFQALPFLLQSLTPAHQIILVVISFGTVKMCISTLQLTQFQGHSDPLS